MKTDAALKMLEIKIEDLIADPQNVRRHDEKNIAAIKGSLARFGQQKPIVINADGVVIAGNGTLAAARDLGWQTIKAVRSALVGDEATAYSIADNRTGELAAWDQEALQAQLQALHEVDASILDAMGFTAADLAMGGEAADREVDLPELTFRVIVVCKTEQDQAALFERLRTEGYECQLLMS
jgi:ParB-like chromosome segregation protein Spo0J